MATQKYYYAIVRKDNANFCFIFGQLPIFWSKEYAKDKGINVFGYNWRDIYTIQKIKITDLENLILKSKKA